MPTGYTYKFVEDNQSFEDFALTCARAFGACIEQREDGLDCKPKLREVDHEYHLQKINDYKEQIQCFQNTSDEDIQKRIDMEYKDDLNYYNKTIKERKALKRRATKALKKAQAYVPPTEGHNNFKEFLIQQINTIINDDASTKWVEKPVKKKLEDYKRDKLCHLKLLLKSTEEAYEKNKQNVEKSNIWIKQLYESLGIDIE